MEQRSAEKRMALEQELQNEKKRAAEQRLAMEQKAAEERMALEQEKDHKERQIAKMRSEQAAADSMVAELKADIARLQQSRQGRNCQLKDAVDFAAEFVDFQDDMDDENEAAAFILATFPS